MAAAAEQCGQTLRRQLSLNTVPLALLFNAYFLCRHLFPAATSEMKFNSYEHIPVFDRFGDVDKVPRHLDVGFVSSMVLLSARVVDARSSESSIE